MPVTALFKIFANAAVESYDLRAVVVVWIAHGRRPSAYLPKTAFLEVSPALWVDRRPLGNRANGVRTYGHPTSTASKTSTVRRRFREGDLGTMARRLHRNKYLEYSLLRVALWRFGAYCVGSKPYGDRREHDKCPGERYYRLKACQ